MSSIMETSTAVDVLSRFGEWVADAVPSVDFTTYTTIDTYYEVDEIETTVTIDLGEFGEQETTVTVYPGEINIYLDEYEVEVSESLDVKEFVTDYSPVTASELADALTAAGEALTRGVAPISLPAAETSNERDVARLVLSLVPPLAGTAGADTAGAVARILAEAFRLANETVNPASVGYNPLTVATDTGTPYDGRRSTVADLRIGDDITSESFGRVVRVVSVNEAARTMTYVCNRNGRENIQTDESFGTSWDVDKVIPPTGTREDLPTALALFRQSNGQTAAVVSGYDPLTVPVEPQVDVVAVEDLRIGDEIPGFGRLVRFDSVDGSAVNYTTNLRGEERPNRYYRDTTWSVNKVLPPNATREATPRAIDLI